MIENGHTMVGAARWTRLAAFGFALTTVGILLYGIAGVAFSLEGIGFLIPFAIVAALNSFLVLRFGNWSKIVGIVIGVLTLLGLGVWTFFGVFQPASFFDFVPGLLVAPGALFGIGGSIGAIVAGRRGHRTVAAEGRERATIRIVTAIVGVLTVLSGVLTYTGRATVADPSAADATAVAKNFKWDPTAYTVAGGSTILVRNDDPFVHTFTIDALDIDVTLGPGSEHLITIPATAGTYVLYCRPHGDPTPDDNAAPEDLMNGTVTVT